MKEQYVIALVRYENSMTFYSTLHAEKREVVYALEGYVYRDHATAQRVITRWSTPKTKGDPTTRKLPYVELSRERMPNGRFQLYAWEPVALDSNGVPGVHDARSKAYKAVEYPNQNVNDPENTRDKLIAFRTPWPLSGPEYAFFVSRGEYKGRLALRTFPGEGILLQENGLLPPAGESEIIGGEAAGEVYE